MAFFLENFFDRLFIFATELERIQGLGKKFFLRRNELVEYDGDIETIMKWTPPQPDSDSDEDLIGSDEEYKQSVSDVEKEQDDGAKEKEQGDTDEETEEDPKTKDKAKGDSKKPKDKSELGKPTGESSKGVPQQVKQGESSEAKPRAARTYRYRRFPEKPKRYGTLGNITVELSDSDE